MTEFYDANAEAFISITRDVDMSDMQQRFLAALPVNDGKLARILDAGSGSGRDALSFRLLGYAVEAFDVPCDGRRNTGTCRRRGSADGVRGFFLRPSV